MSISVEDVSFPSEGLSCAATLYRPEGDDRPLGGLVMGNGFANVRQMYLPTYARAFAAEGLAVLTIDYRFVGESEGEPRPQVLPEAQVDDMRNAITWLSERPEVDPERLGLWGTSFAGGHVLRVASFEPRLRAAVSQVPAVGLWRILSQAEPAVRREFLVKALADRLEFARTGESRMLAITAPAETESVLGERGYDWHRENEERHPSFRNEIAAHSLDRVAAYDPGAFVEGISPTALLMILARNDSVAPPGIGREVFARVGEPKQLVEIGGDHYGVYVDEPTVDLVIHTTRLFLREHLGSGGEAASTDPAERALEPVS